MIDDKYNYTTSSERFGQSVESALICKVDEGKIDKKPSEVKLEKPQVQRWWSRCVAWGTRGFMFDKGSPYEC